MAIPKFLEDLLIISKLGDNPGSDNGLSSSGLRAKFDEAGVKIQQYINNTLIPALSELADPTAGLNMKGNISMGGHRVTGLGEPVEDGDAVPLGYVRKVGNPHNLLDNSDFRNPVNQRGITDFPVSIDKTYRIDRWYTTEPRTIELLPNGIKIGIAQNGITGGLSQRLEHFEVGEKVTFATQDDNGNLCIATVALSDDTDAWVDVGNGVVLRAICLNGNGIFSIGVTDESKTFCWAALYEGEYTAETLPEYQPKGYGAELAECQRYYRQLDRECIGTGYSFGDGHGAAMHLPFTMRVLFPTLVWTYGTIYCRVNGVDYAVNDDAHTDSKDGGNHIVFFKEGIPGKYAAAFYSTEPVALSADL